MLLQDVTRKAGRASTWAAWRRSLSWDWRITLFCYSALLPVLALFAYVRVVPDRRRASCSASIAGTSSAR